MLIRLIIFGYAFFIVASLSGCVSSGSGVMVAEKDILASSGKCIEGNCQDGIGTYELQNGTRYVGKFLQSKFNGDGVLTTPDSSTFKGVYRNGSYIGNGPVHLANFADGVCAKESDCLNGYGSITFSDGRRFNGKFGNGRLNGKGVMHYPDGSEMKGYFFNNLLEGIGMIVSQTGGSYRGPFVKGKKNGEMTIIFPSGNKFVGIFKDDEYVKDGVTTFPNGLSGKCIQGNCINGSGVLLLNDGAKYNGSFKDCRKHGKGTFVSVSGAVYSGSYVKGKRHGIGTYVFPSGIKFVGQYRMGKRNGKGFYVFKNGKKSAVYYKNGVLKK